VLAIIGRIGTAGGTGYTIEFGGSAIRALSMEGRMTVCNMAIEAGARAGLVAVDDKTIAYVQGPPRSRRRAWPGTRPWRTGARCSPTPARTSTPWSSSTPRRSGRRSPGAPARRWCCPSTDRVPDPDKEKDAVKRGAIERALVYMGLQPNKAIADITIDKVFIGSCTNSRIEDLREAAAVVRAWAGAWRPTSSWRWSCPARAR
jgi:3-isopropylmalate/(R)-2-methylmalate dehydratase large subunit